MEHALLHSLNLDLTVMPNEVDTLTGSYFSINNNDEQCWNRAHGAPHAHGM